MTIFKIYIICVIFQLIVDLTIDLGTKGTRFNLKWVLDIILSMLLSPLTPIYNLVMAIFLRRKGIYIFIEDKKISNSGWISLEDEKPPKGLNLVHRDRMFAGSIVNEVIILDVKESWTKEDMLDVWDNWQPIPETPVNKCCGNCDNADYIDSGFVCINSEICIIFSNSGCEDNWKPKEDVKEIK
jgi:hypothetical protein